MLERETATGPAASAALQRAESHPSWHRFDEIPQSILNDPETIRLNLSGGWQQIPAHILDAARVAVDEGFLRIQPVPDFTPAVAEKFQQDLGVSVDPASEVIACHGAGDGVFATLSVLLNPGDEVITFDPGFTYSYVIPAYLGATVKTIPLPAESGWVPDTEAVLAQLDQLIGPRTRVFMLVNPENPTGHVFRRPFLEALGERLSQRGILVVEDQVYEKVIYPPHEYASMLSVPAMRDSTVCVSSFAKSYLCAGMKVGYVVGPPALVKSLQHYYMLNSFTPNTAAMRTAVEILRGPQGFQRTWVREWDELRHKTTDALNSIPGVFCNLPESGTYCFADVSSLGSADEIAGLLAEEARVLVTPGSHYGPSGHRYIRVCYGRTQPERIVEGLGRIVETLSSAKSRAP
jgi:aspartate/methionine/tyrosine aminotransferase